MNKETIIEKILPSIKNRNGDELSVNTIKSYKSKIKTILELDKEIFNKIISEKNIIPLFKIFIKNFGNNVKDYITPIIKIFETPIGNSLLNNNNKIDILKKILVKTIEINKNNEIDKTDNSNNKINWNEYKNFVYNITKKNIDIRAIILFNLYLLYPVRDDYGDILMRSGNTKRKINYYNLNTQKIYIKNYKTCKTYGDLVLKIPDYLHKIILDYHNSNGNFNEYLIENDNNNRYSDGKLHLLIERFFIKYYKKKISINDIRHSVVSYYHKNKTKKEQIKLSKIMGHCYQTAALTYDYGDSGGGSGI